MYDNNFEKVPGSFETNVEREVPLEQDFSKSFTEEGMPEFAGEQFGVANEENEFYGESNDEKESESEYNEDVADAASLINYGLDAVAREKGVEVVVQGIKSFDASNSENPLRDLYNHLGIDTTEEFKDVREESDATKPLKAKFREEYSMPKTQERSREGAIKAIADMKELISEVEGADPRYEELRNAARSYGKGYFEYAVKDFGLQGLSELFSVLASQKEKSEQEDYKDNNQDNSEQFNQEHEESTSKEQSTKSQETMENLLTRIA